MVSLPTFEAWTSRHDDLLTNTPPRRPMWKDVKEGYVTSYPHRYLLGAFEYREVPNLHITRYLTAGRIRFLLQRDTTLKAHLICNHFLYFKEPLPVLLRFDAHDTSMWVVNMHNSHCHRKTLTVRRSRVRGDRKCIIVRKKCRSV